MTMLLRSSSPQMNLNWDLMIETKIIHSARTATFMVSEL